MSTPGVLPVLRSCLSLLLSLLAPLSHRDMRDHVEPIICSPPAAPRSGCVGIIYAFDAGHLLLCPGSTSSRSVLLFTEFRWISNFHPYFLKLRSLRLLTLHTETCCQTVLKSWCESKESGSENKLQCSEMSSPSHQKLTYCYWTKYVSLLASQVVLPMQESQIWSLGCEDPLEKGMATRSSILAWKNLMDRAAWWATVHEVVKSWTWLND